jgi:microcompartment protein CcmK/EutM
MQLARVIGDVVATVKDANLHSHKLLILQPVLPDRTAAGRAVVAVDSTKEASFPFLPSEPPVDACVVGIVDEIDVQETGSRPGTIRDPVS